LDPTATSSNRVRIVGIYMINQTAQIKLFNPKNNLTTIKSLAILDPTVISSNRVRIVVIYMIKVYPLLLLNQILHLEVKRVRKCVNLGILVNFNQKVNVIFCIPVNQDNNNSQCLFNRQWGSEDQKVLILKANFAEIGCFNYVIIKIAKDFTSTL
jgi:hypothetical protein